MKTIEEKAREYSDLISERDFSPEEEFIDGFKKCAEFMRQWISVEDENELPIFEGAEFQILVKGHKNNPDKVICWTVGVAGDERVIRTAFTHWRPINYI